jgi:hypothetical protein
MKFFSEAGHSGIQAGSVITLGHAGTSTMSLMETGQLCFDTNFGNRTARWHTALAFMHYVSNAVSTDGCLHSYCTLHCIASPALGTAWANSSGSKFGSVPINFAPYHEYALGRGV